MKPIRNLLIVHTPNHQDISDWLEVKRRIEVRAPDIETRIATNGARNSLTSRWQVSRPSLVFSPFPLYGYQPKGGTIYAGGPISKLEQIERLTRQGLPVPPTLRLRRDLTFDPVHWGRYVVVKPLYGLLGKGVRLVEREDVAKRYDELTLNDTQEMVIQPYIEHSQDGYPTEYRVLTMFGAVLYSARNSWAVPRRPLVKIASEPDGIIASNNRQSGRVRTVSNDAEIIALGEQAHAAFPDRPVLGVDVIRDTDTEKLYVMEVNPSGPWHFSSSLGKSFAADHIRDLYAQYGALERAARLLIERTRTEAT